MDREAITRYLRESFAGIVPVAAWGETSFFYNPGKRLPRGVYFATIKERDGEHDQASALWRPEVFRLNIGISATTYRSLFGALPARPTAGGVIEGGHDFTTIDRLMPHPVYGWMGWISVLNPSIATFDSVKPLLIEAHGLAVRKFEKRVAQLPCSPVTQTANHSGQLPGISKKSS